LVFFHKKALPQGFLAQDDRLGSGPAFGFFEKMREVDG